MPELRALALPPIFRLQFRKCRQRAALLASQGAGVAAPGPTFGVADSIFVEAVKATREIKASLEAIGGAKQSVSINLPFKVLSNFVDPYHPDGNGIALVCDRTTMSTLLLPAKSS